MVDENKLRWAEMGGLGDNRMDGHGAWALMLEDIKGSP